MSEQVAELQTRVDTQPSVPQSTLPDLEAVRDRILTDLKLGKQAPGYKAAVKALDRFIKEVQPRS